MSEHGQTEAHHTAGHAALAEGSSGDIISNLTGKQVVDTHHDGPGFGQKVGNAIDSGFNAVADELDGHTAANMIGGTGAIVGFAFFGPLGALAGFLTGRLLCKVGGNDVDEHRVYPASPSAQPGGAGGHHEVPRI